jgi:2-dehydropantoate 2-reductase
MAQDPARPARGETTHAPSMIAVLGPGGIGGLIAAALSNAGEDVVVIAREETAERINREGLRVKSRVLGEFHARPRATERLTEKAEVLIVTTKAGGLEQALERVEVEPAVVVPLLNGVDHVEAVRERFGNVAAGTIRVASHREGTVIHQTSSFLRVELAGAEELAQKLREAGIPADVHADETTILWSKLARLNVLALATTRYGTMAEARVHPDDIEAVVEETAAVANAAGVPVDVRAIKAEIADVDDDFMSSMARDRAAGRPLELDAIAGAVQRAGARHGIPTPTIDRLRTEIERAQ